MAALAECGCIRGSPNVAALERTHECGCVNLAALLNIREVAYIRKVA